MMLTEVLGVQRKQSAAARQRARDRFGVFFGILDLCFAPVCIAGMSLGVAYFTFATLLSAATVVFFLLSPLETAKVRRRARRPPPQLPRLPHVCLAPRLLPTPNFARR